MAIIQEKDKVSAIFENAAKKKMSIAIFCTASHWNTEAILMAADSVAKKFGISRIPVAIAMTYTYHYMPQAKRVLRCQRPEAGFLSMMEHMKVLCDGAYAPYPNVDVLPHLDHADPEKDKWGVRFAKAKGGSTCAG